MKDSRFTEEQIIRMTREQEADAKTKYVWRKRSIIQPPLYIYGLLPRCKSFSVLI